jgi:ABC-type dipeptide/oligopeptide/nickel transport system permease subunit
MSVMSKERREIYVRRVSGFWKDFSHNKVGLVGLAIIGVYIFIAIAAPYITPYYPINMPVVSSSFAMPQWVKMFPQFSDLPPTIWVPLNWTESEAYPAMNVQYGMASNVTYSRALAPNDTLGEMHTYEFQAEFDYPYSTPRQFESLFQWAASFNNLSYRVMFNITTPDNLTFPLAGDKYDRDLGHILVPDFYWNMSMGNWLVTSGDAELTRVMNFERFLEEFYPTFYDRYVNSQLNFTAWNSSIYAYEYNFQKRLWVYTYYDMPLANYTQDFVQNVSIPAFDEYFNNYWNGNETWHGWNASVSQCTNTWGRRIDSRTRWPYLKSQHYSDQNASYFVGYGSAANQTYFNQTLWPEYYYGNDTWGGYWTIYGEPRWEQEKLRLADAADAYAISESTKAANELCSTYNLSPAEQIFTKKGNYTLRLTLIVQPFSEDANLSISFDPQSRFRVWGLVHGALGSDGYGKDVFTQLVYGARISLIVGSLAAILATSLEIVFGVTAGYLGGIVDELTMRVVDVLLCLPVLPLLLALSAYFRPNVYFIVLIIAIFGWQGGARVIRSRVLTLREMPFVESAKSSGASDSYLIFRHLIPNVFPIAIASMILAVPAAVITEAALSFLGFGDPTAPTWGKMLQEASDSGAFSQLAWHYVLPPGFAITILCVAFVFVGHALDEIVNPRLRRRR